MLFHGVLCSSCSGMTSVTMLVVGVLLLLTCWSLALSQVYLFFLPDVKLFIAINSSFYMFFTAAKGIGIIDCGENLFLLDWCA